MLFHFWYFDLIELETDVVFEILKGLHVGRRKVAGGLLLPSLGAICWQVPVSGQGMAQVIVIHAVIKSYGCSMVRPGT